MADASIPGAIYNQNPTPGTLESQPVGALSGAISNIGAGIHSGLGGSLETQAIGKLAGGQMMPYEDVKAAFDAEKLDASVFPKGQPVSAGEVMTVRNQQLAIQADQDRAERAHLGGFTRGVTGFIGGVLDPSFTGGGLIAGPLLGAAKAGLGITGARVVGAGATLAVERGAPLAARVVTGAAEGGAVVGGYEKAEQQFGTAQGDRDITSGQMLHDALWSSVVGGALKGGFGKKVTSEPISQHLDMIRYAENSEGYAKAHGISPDEVVSANTNPDKRAYGLFQITPETAKSLGFSGDPEMLKKRDYNQQVAEANMEKLYNKFGNDSEAIAIAWNAGPGVADRFIKAGRDYSKLPKETQGYLKRIQGQYTFPPAEDKPLAPTAVLVRGYHGTAADFETFDEGKQGTSSFARDAKGATFFTSDPDIAAGYANFAAKNVPEGSDIVGQNIRPVDLTLHNPETVDWEGQMYNQTKFKTIIDKAKAEGKDGVIFKNVNDDPNPGGQKLSEVYASFHPNDAAKPGFGTRGVPDKTDIAVVKTALAQAEAGSEINVEPIVKGMADEDAGIKTDPKALAEAIPVRDSAATNIGKEKLAAIDEQAKSAKPAPIIPTVGRAPHPDVAEIQRLAKEAVSEAQAVHTGLTGETEKSENNRFANYMKAGEKEFEESEEGIEGQPDTQKAIEAAVQCGLKNGTE